MSFDVFMQKFENGDSALCTPQEHSSIHDTLKTYGYDGPDEYGFYIVHFSNGASVEFSAAGLDAPSGFGNCALHMRGFHEEVITFIYKIATVGNFVIINAQANGTPESPMFIVINEAQTQHLPDGEDFHNAQCDHPEHLAALLTGDFNSWSSWKDKIVDTYNNK